MATSQTRLSGASSGSASGEVLVVEDDDDIGDAILQLLDDVGMDGVHVRSCSEALAHLRAHAAPALILLDVMMPAMDGLALRREQLQDPVLSAIPVVTMSAAADAQTLAAFVTPHWLRKPFRAESLLRMITHVRQESSADAMPSAAHAVCFYREGRELAAHVERLLDRALREGDAVLLIADGCHHDAFAAAADTVQRAHGKPASHAQLALLDASAVLARISSDDGVDGAAFARVVGAHVRASVQASPTGRIRAFGDMVDVLAKRGDWGAALRLERMWNALLADTGHELLCAYSDAAPRDMRVAVGAEHGHVFY